MSTKYVNINEESKSLGNSAKYERQPIAFNKTQTFLNITSYRVQKAGMSVQNSHCFLPPAAFTSLFSYTTTTFTTLSGTDLWSSTLFHTHVMVEI